MIKLLPPGGRIKQVCVMLRKMTVKYYWGPLDPVAHSSVCFLLYEAHSVPRSIDPWCKILDRYNGLVNEWRVHFGFRSAAP
jgi:hypothetical protein